jgi:hypothetical protein
LLRSLSDDTRTAAVKKVIPGRSTAAPEQAAGQRVPEADRPAVVAHDPQPHRGLAGVRPRSRVSKVTG